MAIQQKIRKIIEIDEEKCTGCGECVTSCAEGALAIIDGKARLVNDKFCDGFGACIRECPEDALKIIEREAEEFDEALVEKILEAKGEKHMHNHSHNHVESHAAVEKEPLFSGCPSSKAMFMKKPQTATREAAEISSELTHWPIKLQLLMPGAPFFKDQELLLLADCCAAAYPNLHENVLRGKAVAMGCPKLDDLDAHIDKLAQIVKHSGLKALKVVHMEVPCCHGFYFAAQQAIEKSGINIPLKKMIISRHGEILHEDL
jgi:Pyruvate/2-oxoacid:ferredoxin oxidoreductase delta subunit